MSRTTLELAPRLWKSSSRSSCLALTRQSDASRGLLSDPISHCPSATLSRLHIIMAGKLDQSLDEIVSSQRRSTRRPRSRRVGGSSRTSAAPPVGGVKKSTQPARGAIKGKIPTGPAATSGDSKVIVSNLVRYTYIYTISFRRLTSATAFRCQRDPDQGMSSMSSCQLWVSSSSVGRLDLRSGFRARCRHRIDPVHLRISFAASAQTRVL